MSDSCCFESKSTAQPGGAMRTSEKRLPRKTEEAEFFLDEEVLDSIDLCLVSTAAVLMGGKLDGVARRFCFQDSNTHIGETAGGKLA
jgi:hypothetical protein